MAREKRESICMFCSLGCPVGFEAEADVIKGIAFESAQPVHHGLCSRGSGLMDLTNHPFRLWAPKVKEGRVQREVRWESALRSVSDKLTALTKEFGKDSVGVIIHANATNEEFRLASDFAQKVMGTSNFDIAIPCGDWELLESQQYAEDGKPRAKFEDLDSANCILIVGDAFHQNPCIAKRILDAKYKVRRNTVVVMDSVKSSTAMFANQFVQVSPGSEAIALLGLLREVCRLNPDGTKSSQPLVAQLTDETLAGHGVSVEGLKRAAEMFVGPPQSAAIVCANSGKICHGDVVGAVAERIAEGTKGKKTYLPLLTYGNSVGAYAFLKQTGRRTTVAEMMHKAAEGKLKGLLVLDVDLPAEFPTKQTHAGLEKLSYLVVSALFRNELTDRADVVLPSSCWLEGTGTVTISPGKEVSLQPAVSPPGGAKSLMETLEILAAQIRGAGDAETAKTSSLPPKEALEKQASRRNLQQTVNQLVQQTASQANGKQLLVGEMTSVHFDDGSITRRLSWAKSDMPEPYLEISDEDAAGLNVKDGNKVKVLGAQGDAVLKARISPRVKKGTLAAPFNFPEVRALFGWEMDPASGRWVGSPAAVSLEKV